MRILYQGLLRSPASWARVGRGYLEGFLRLGLRAEAISPRGFLHDPRFPLSEGIIEVKIDEVRSGSPPDVGLGFLHPPHLGRLLGRLRANLFVWESDKLPAGWAEQLDQGTDLVLVPSEFTREVLVLSSFPPEKVRVVTYGFDERLLDVPPRSVETRLRQFTFLAVLAPHWRKGVAELLRAYRTAFDDGDRALLRIKTTHDPASSRVRRSFEIPSWAEALQAAGLMETGAPRVQLDVRVLNDDEIPAVYAGADVVVAPTWGESFGLVILEGLAAARPVLATAWSGHMDFLPGGPDAIPYNLIEAGDRLYEPAPLARVAVPRIEELASRMRWHFDHAEESGALGLNARDCVARLTWAYAARRLVQVLSGSVTSAGGQTS